MEEQRKNNLQYLRNLDSEKFKSFLCNKKDEMKNIIKGTRKRAALHMFDQQFDDGIDNIEDSFMYPEESYDCAKNMVKDFIYGDQELKALLQKGTFSLQTRRFYHCVNKMIKMFCENI